MKNQTPIKKANEGAKITKQVSWVRLLFVAIITPALPALVLFCSSGRLDWVMAWAYIGMTTAFFFGSRIVMLRKSPGLIVERSKSMDKADTKPWDKVLMPLVTILFPTVMLIVAGLDVRYGWSPKLPLPLQIASLIIAALGYFLNVWATIVNKFFSGVVRIQRERGHTVITSGPYKYIRHPGYAGGMVTNFTIPIMLGSLWALVPAVIGNGLLIIRTILEDRTLQDELDGYHNYAKQVRYRLLPGIW
jgi:protein-S-isoprenylcysteine O-methyltransferase Ste14